MSDDTKMSSDKLNFSGNKDKKFKDSGEKLRKQKGRGFMDSSHSRSYSNFKSSSQDIPRHSTRVSSTQKISKNYENSATVDENIVECIPQESVDGWVLFVTGIHEEATEDEIREIFATFGTIEGIEIMLDHRTGFLKGCALVKFKNYSEALQAKESVQGTELLGKTLSVDWCFTARP